MSDLPPKIRCAIYTRKSTDEGLEREFNSLDAQRESCVAYIASQKHQGWELVDGLFDDGGFSGGSLDRPALKRLLALVEAGKVDVIVVYKVDRLTRSLTDFARIVDILDRKSASFVSVTQSFNTTTSMGRLTLNVLLSFAQFEREVTGERIRDKIAASKAKGMWMGGPVPLGYEVRDRELIVNDDQARIVRHIFRRYVALRSIRALVDELAHGGYRSKLRDYKDGTTKGGVPFQKGPLASLLQNRIYVGEIVHRGVPFPGRHASIIDAQLFDEAAATIAENRRARLLGTRVEQPSLLTGMLFDRTGRPMTPTHASRQHRRYRYYTSRLKPGDGASVVRIPAGEIERVVICLFQRHLTQTPAAEIVEEPSAATIEQHLHQSAALAAQLPTMAISRLRGLLLGRRAKVSLLEDLVRLEFQSGADAPTIALEVPVRLCDRGSDVRLSILPDSASKAREPDPVLLKLVVHAHAAREVLMHGKHSPLVDGYSREHLVKLLRLTCLAPDIVSAIVEGRQPVELTGRRLLRAANIPHAWAEQRRLFGFA